MKTFSIFVIGVYIASLLIIKIASGSEFTLDEDEQACIIETEVSEDLVLESKSTYTVPADNQRYKTFLSCCWKRYGYQNHNGNIEWEEIHKILMDSFSSVVARKLIEKCDKIKGVTDGDTVALVLRCLDDHAPSIHTLHSHYSGHHY